MSCHPPPPGSTSQPISGHSTPKPHALPARPPPSAAPSSAHNAGFSFKPRNVASPAAPGVTQAPAAQYQQHSQYYPYGAYGVNNQSYPQAAAAPPSYHPPSTDYYGGAYQDQSQYVQPNYGQPQASQYGLTPPQIHNPFAPPPPQGASQYGSMYGSQEDIEAQAQIRQWQSQFGAAPVDPKAAAASAQGKNTRNANTTPLAYNRLEGGAPATTTSAAAAKPGPTTAEEQNKTVVRKGGGETWEDPTLLEWGNHHRLFIGNLAGEVTDESLLKAFSKYPSVQKARVVRDKRTTKSKGFGFVSLADADEYFQAAKEMQGKYIGSHPVLVRRAETEIKATNKRDDRGKKNGKKSGGGGGNGGGGGAGASGASGKKEDKGVLASQAGAGVKKAGKVEGKYKLLG